MCVCCIVLCLSAYIEYGIIANQERCCQCFDLRVIDVRFILRAQFAVEGLHARILMLILVSWCVVGEVFLHVASNRTYE